MKTLSKLIFITLCFGISGCNNKSPSNSKPNLILISLDTLRADRLGAYGYTRDTSPNIDKLSQKSAMFLNASSASSWTLPAHVSMLSGQYPSTHGVTQKKGNKISNQTKILSEILKDHGYRTWGIASGGYLSSAYGFKRGFEEYSRTDLKSLKNSSEEMIDIRTKNGAIAVGTTRAKEKIEMLDNKEPFFIFIHTYDIHCPFNPPEPYYSMYKTASRQEIDSSKCIQNEDSDSLTKEQVWTLSDRYDGGIRWVDESIGKFFDWFYTTEASKNTFVIITSDHGEEFFEHNHIDHRNSLYKELVHIPLLIIGPGIKAGKYNNPISLVDIVPTALELLRVDNKLTFDGTAYASLLLNGKSTSPLPSWRLAELDRGKILRSSYDDSSNMIIEKDTSTDDITNKEYYFHPDDPKEQNNKFDLNNNRVSDRYKELNEKLKSLKNKSGAEGQIKEDQKVEETPENLEELKTLGYF